MVDEPLAHEAVNTYIDDAATLIDLPSEMRLALMSPVREIAVQIPVRRDDGRMLLVRGYRVQHNDSRGPFKGGIRYHPSVDLERGARAGVAHDVEDGAGRRPLRRRQGRHRGRSRRMLSKPSSSGMTRRFTLMIAHRSRPLPRHPGARREHQRPGRWRG